MTKCIIFDSGALINITQNGLIEIFMELAEKFQGDFIITDGVKYETIEHPLKIKRFEWGALRIQKLLEEEIIRLAQDDDLVSFKELNEKTEEILNEANSSFFQGDKQIHLIERGEAECIALSRILSSRGIDNVTVIDERTARMLCENPDNLAKIMENKLHVPIRMNKENLRKFKDTKIIRSTELIYLAYKKSAMEKDKKKLEAILYALKFGGCSISEKEVMAIVSS